MKYVINAEKKKNYKNMEITRNFVINAGRSQISQIKIKRFIENTSIYYTNCFNECIYLIERGFKFIKTRKNINGPDFYGFEYTRKINVSHSTFNRKDLL
jgi:hypothetical protein